MMLRDKLLPLGFLILMTGLCVWAVANSKVMLMGRSFPLHEGNQTLSPILYANSEILE